MKKKQEVEDTRLHLENEDTVHLYFSFVVQQFSWYVVSIEASLFTRSSAAVCVGGRLGAYHLPKNLINLPQRA